MGNYKVNIGGVAITVNAIKHPSLISGKLSKFKTQLLQHRVVGIDAPSKRWLILCAGNCCLVIDLFYVNPIPETLKSFLADETICFVTTQMNKIIDMGFCKIEVKTRVELGYVASLVLKKCNLEQTDLEGLASLVGLQVDTNLIRSTSSNPVNWYAHVFTNDEMPRVICYSYYSYVVGNKLLGML